MLPAASQPEGTKGEKADQTDASAQESQPRTYHLRGADPEPQGSGGRVVGRQSLRYRESRTGLAEASGKKRTLRVPHCGVCLGGARLVLLFLVLLRAGCPLLRLLLTLHAGLRLFETLYRSRVGRIDLHDLPIG